MRRKAAYSVAVCLALLAFVVGLFPERVLPWPARYLVQADEVASCDCLFVLAGDFQGQRIAAAGDLFRKGLAPKIFVSGPQGIYGRSEDELAIAFAKQAGYADVPFQGLSHEAKSTKAEAALVLGSLREAGCKSVLVVTSDFHTRRAKRILMREWPGLTVRMAGAPTKEFDSEHWWQDRNYQKTVYFEWSKTIADWIGL